MTTLPTVNIGDVLADKYRVEKVLGQGGMGIVVAAHHLQLDQRVAIKLMLPELAANEEAIARFLREARAAAKIKSEHVTRVFDVATLANGAPYIVMEYLDGVDLGGLVSQRGAFRVEDAVELLLQTCEVLADAHALGIIHRDLKPANLFCVQNADGLPAIKVLDFGISKLIGDAGRSDIGMTKTAAGMGSPLYMSPEQMQSARDVDNRTDVWSLGVILYELLAGRLPFQGASWLEVGIMIATKAPPPLRELRPETPPALATIVSRCLEKEREKRYASVAELAVALGPFGPRRAHVSVERILRIAGSSHGAHAPRARAPGAHTEETRFDTTKTANPGPVGAPDGAGRDLRWAGSAPPWGATTPPRKSGRSGWLIAGVGAGSLVAAGAAGLVAMRNVSTNVEGAEKTAIETSIPAPAAKSVLATPPADIRPALANDIPNEAPTIAAPVASLPAPPALPFALPDAAFLPQHDNESPREVPKRAPGKIAPLGAPRTNPKPSAPVTSAPVAVATPAPSAAAQPKPSLWGDRK